MKIRFNLMYLALSTCFFSASGVSEESPFIKIFVQNIKNESQVDCDVEHTHVPSLEKLKLARPLEIPFISIKHYLREYASKKAYTPQAALKIETPHWQYRLWSSESGVMLARNPQDAKVSLENWKAKKILSNGKHEHPGKKLYLASLVFKVINNKFTISLVEPARS
jgi:hypothetical protein